MGKALLITADRLWDGTASTVLEDAFVLVEGTTIAAIGRQADLGETVDGAERVELPGTTLLPGLINGHVHMALSGSPTPVDDYLREAGDGLPALTIRAVANLQAALRVGVTTVRDLGGPNEVTFTVRDAIAEGRLVGPRVMASGRPITVTGGHCHWFSHECDSEVEVRAATRRQVKDGADVVKIFATGGNYTPRTNPFAPQFTVEELTACVSEARRLGVPVSAHAHAPEGIRRAVTARVSTVEHCFFETPDGVAYDRAVADEMATNAIACVLTAGASLRRMAADPSIPRTPVVERVLGKLAALRDVWRRLYATGVPLILGTDAGIIPNRSFANFPADVGILVGDDGLVPGMGYREALMAVTSEAARVLGLSDTGALVPGRRADLLAVEGNPLSRIDDLVRTRFVMVGGYRVPVQDA
jgi:imidazolonepropionase-like amidohydrolase